MHTAENTARKSKKKKKDKSGSLHVMGSNTTELHLSSTVNMNENVKLSSSNDTGMNSCDSWRHISNIVKLERCSTGVKQTFCQIFLSLHYQIDRWITILILDHKEGKQTIWFTPHTCSTLSTVFGLHWFVSVAKLHVSSTLVWFASLAQRHSPTVKLNLILWGVKTRSGSSWR